MDSTVFKAFDSIKLPGVEETKKQAMQESILFPAVNEISAEWIRQSQIYHFLFGIIFKERTGVERLEERILKRAIAPAREDSENYYQKYDRMGLRFFYIRGTARVERLKQDDRELLRLCDERKDTDSFQKALIMVEKTFATIMAVSPENPTTVYEPKQTIHGDYKIIGKNIPIAMRSVPSFSPDGSLKSEKAELKRIRTFTNIWRQVDSAFSIDLGCGTTTAIEVFDV